MRGSPRLRKVLLRVWVRASFCVVRSSYSRPLPTPGDPDTAS